MSFYNISKYAKFHQNWYINEGARAVIAKIPKSRSLGVTEFLMIYLDEVNTPVPSLEKLQRVTLIWF